MKAKILSWDWKSQPNFAELARLITEVTGVAVQIRQVETGSDQFTVVISSGALAVGDIVAVLNVDGAVAYYGEIDRISGDRDHDRHVIGVWNPDTDEIHYVAAANGEGIRLATEAEADDYLDGVIDRYGEDHQR